MRWLLLSFFTLALLGCGKSVDSDIVPTANVAGTRVIVTNPQQRSIDYTLTALGTVESIHNPTISAETSGQLVGIEVSEGQTVDAQQLLASIDNTLYSIKVDKAAGELKRQKALLDNQQREVNHLLRLAKSQSVSKDKLDDEQSQLQMFDLAYRADARRWAWCLDADQEIARDRIETISAVINSRVPGIRMKWSRPQIIRLDSQRTVWHLTDLLVRQSLSAASAARGFDSDEVRPGTEPIAPSAIASERLDAEVRRLTADR